MNYDEPIENSIFHFNFDMFMIWLNLFSLTKGDNNKDSASDNLWWICILLVGIIVLTMIVIRCWLCCDPNCEQTKEKMKELKKKFKKFFSRCFPCCESDDIIIEPIRNNCEASIIMDSKIDFNLRTRIYDCIDNNDTNNKDNYANNIPVSKPQVLDPSINFMNEINIPCNDSNQIVDKKKTFNDSNKEILVYFPASSSRITPSHIFNNIA
jgi:hypothetical protein